MKTAISIAFLSLLVVVGSLASCSSPNGQQVPDPIQIPTVDDQNAPQSDTGEGIEVISVNVENVSDTGKDTEVVYRNSNPRPPYSSRPVFDYDYDDSWVANIPEVIGGYEVIGVSTPNKVACNRGPIITLLAPRRSMNEFLGNPPDVHSLRSMIRAIPGVLSDIRLSFAGSVLDEEEAAKNLREWNEDSLKDGCIVLGGVPDELNERIDEALDKLNQP